MARLGGLSLEPPATGGLAGDETWRVTAVVEGPSAAGKTTWVRRIAAEKVVLEHEGIAPIGELRPTSSPGSGHTPTLVAGRALSGSKPSSGSLSATPTP